MSGPRCGSAVCGSVWEKLSEGQSRVGLGESFSLAEPPFPQMQDGDGSGACPTKWLRGSQGMIPEACAAPCLTHVSCSCWWKQWLQGQALKLRSLCSDQIPALHISCPCLFLHL